MLTSSVPPVQSGVTWPPWQLMFEQVLVPLLKVGVPPDLAANAASNSKLTVPLLCRLVPTVLSWQAKQVTFGSAKWVLCAPVAGGKP